MEDAVLAVDVGTSALKAGLCTRDGRLIARASEPLEQFRQPPQQREVAPASWYAALAHAVGSLHAAAPESAIRGIVVSGNGPTLVAVSSHGQAVFPALSWLDRRSETEARELRGAWHGEVDASHFLPKMMWLARHEPAAYAATRWFLSCPEYISFILTGQAWTVLPAPGFEPYYWTDRAVAHAGIDAEKLPPFLGAGQPMGVVREEVLGIPPGTPVYSGGPDFLMSLLGTATMRAGIVCDRAGTSEGVNLCSPRPVEDVALMCYPHLSPGMHNISAVLGGTGLVVEWLRALCRRDEGTVFRGIEGVPPGAGGLVFLPHLPGGRSPALGGASRGAFVGLTDRHTHTELARAVAESLGFAVGEILDLFRGHGMDLRAVRITGGQARGGHDLQVRADIAGVPLEVPAEIDAELVGCGALGWTGMGEYDSPLEASDAMVRIARTYEPDSALAAVYADLGELRRRSLTALSGVLSRLAGYTQSC